MYRFSVFCDFYFFYLFLFCFLFVVVVGGGGGFYARFSVKNVN
jgi:hypothetical protein